MNPRDKVSNPNDLRVQRTRKLLSNALIDLMQLRPFGSISVIDICDAAMIHRTTFYSHFVDKYDLLRYTIDDKQREFIKKSKSDNHFETVADFYVDTFRQVVRFLGDNLDLFTSSCSRGGGMEVLVTRRILADSIHSYITEHRNVVEVSEMPPEIETQCIAGAMMSLAAWWLEENMPVTEDELCHYVALLLLPWRP